MPRRAFTLLELLVVFGILLLLLGMILPAVQRVRGAADRATCMSNLRQIGIALHAYQTSRRVLPAGCSYKNGADPFPFMSWHARILPLIEQDGVWEQAREAYRKDKLFWGDSHDLPRSTVVTLFTCPSDNSARRPHDFGPFIVAFTSYLGVEGTNQFLKNGALFLDSQVRLDDVKDGTSHTLLVGERPPPATKTIGWWYAGWGQAKNGSAEMMLGVREHNVYKPGCAAGPYHFGPGRDTNVCDTFHFWSWHSGGANFLFCDGSVRFLGYAADPVLPALATRAGGEVVSIADYE
jgi:prepilin-type processing-associated H-X9-DG protein